MIWSEPKRCYVSPGTRTVRFIVWYVVIVIAAVALATREGW